MTIPTQRLIDQIQSSEGAYEDALPPVHLWNPELNGDLDMRIDREGRWYYQGDEIRRPAMVKMFSTVLKREGDEYFLVTPVEKWRITVDVAPFIITNAEKQLSKSKEEFYVFTTNVDTEFVLGGEHKLWMSNLDVGAEPQPLVSVRHGMEALISRNVFYQLVNDAIVHSEGGREGMYISSQGEEFCLGYLD